MKILVTGGTGMLGTDLQEIMPNATYISSFDYDLTCQQDVINMFETYRPDVVIHLAAKVGGICDNINLPAQYFDDNVLMNTLVLKYAYRYGVKKFIGMLSTCVYPDYNTGDQFTDLFYPIKESQLHRDKPAASNFSYGIAKRALAAQIESYNKQYGTDYCYFIPANLYGPNDKFDDDKSHFVAALLKKIYTAVNNNENEIMLWGTGKPLRQFVYSKDVAAFIKYCVEKSIYCNVNIAGAAEYSIDQIAKIALKACNATHLKIKYDTDKPDGQMRKTASMQLFNTKFPFFKFTPLEDGIQKTYDAIVNRGKAFNKK